MNLEDYDGQGKSRYQESRDSSQMLGTILLLLLVTIVAVAGVILYKHHSGTCNHGESSVTATKVNGKWVVSKPHRTGC